MACFVSRVCTGVGSVGSFHVPTCVAARVLTVISDGRHVFMDAIDADVDHRFSTSHAQQTIEWVGPYLQDLRRRHVPLYSSMR